MTKPALRSLAWAALLAPFVVAPTAAADHDGDPLNDAHEPLVCGTPALATLVNSLPSSAGRCSNGDFVTPLLNPSPCPDCEGATPVSLLDAPLTPSEDVEPQGATLPQVPAQGPSYTPPVDQPIGTVWGYPAAGTEQYCVRVTPASPGSVVAACVDVGPLAPLLPPVGPVPLVDVGSQQVGPTEPVGPIPLGPTPGMHVPATSIDVVAAIRWEEDRLNDRVTTDGLRVVEPVDFDHPEASRWWAENGDQTTLHLRVILRADGAPLQSLDAWVPYAGQAAAAVLATADSLP